MRAGQWRLNRLSFERSISGLQQVIGKLEQDVSNLASIAAEEAINDARENVWGTRSLYSSLMGVNDTEVEKADRDRKRQERKIEKDLKERRLATQKAQLLEKQTQMNEVKKEIDAADLRNDQAINALENQKRAREARENAEREKLEREKLAERERAERERLEKTLKQQREQQQKEAEERKAYAQQQAEARAAEWARQEQQHHDDNDDSDRSSTGQAHSPSCDHGYWWDKAQFPNRTNCPVCGDVWGYLLECPGCKRQACPKCQRDFRPTASRNTRRG